MYKHLYCCQQDKHPSTRGSRLQGFIFLYSRCSSHDPPTAVVSAQQAAVRGISHPRTEEETEARGKEGWAEGCRPP